jgi:hypothetical protein
MKRPSTVVCIVTNRQIPSEDEQFTPNVCQLFVGALEEADVNLIVDELAVELNVKIQKLTPNLLMHIGGHPVLARAYVRLAEQYGTTIFERSPKKFFAIQDGILQDSLNASRLDSVQKKILHVLSWLPRLDAFALERICCEPSDDLEQYNARPNDLILGCLVEAKGSAFTIANPVRAIFRRQFGYGPLSQIHCRSEIPSGSPWRTLSIRYGPNFAYAEF